MKLKELRKINNLTQQELSQKLGMTQSNYGKYELGAQEPDLKTLFTLADYYNVSLDYLCGHETKHMIDTSMWSETRKGIVFTMNQLTEQNCLILLGYITHMLKQQNS